MPTPVAPHYVIGLVDHVNPAYAYVVPTEEAQADVWVKQEDLLGALDRDLVKVVVLQQATGGKRAVGRVVEIIKRNQTSM